MALIGHDGMHPAMHKPAGRDECSMADTILITYTTRYGSTAEVAEAIADELNKAGEAVVLLPINEVTDLSPYRAVIIGSPIYMGKWLPEPQVFVERHQEELRNVPVAFFAVGLSVADNTVESRKRAEASMDQVRLLVRPVHIGVFTGQIIPERLSLSDRAITTLIRAPSGDYRNWDAIRTWAREIRPILDR
jgi:menaquinone-dependent protoporphyrinogen oxidase